MYEEFFGFRDRPFRLVPDPAYLYLSRGHEEALAHLAYAASRGEGFVEITGEVGTGKTTLCRVFLENLDENTEAAFIFNPKLTATQLLKAVCDEFAIASPADNNKDLIDALNTFLMRQRTEGKNVILVIDEAQNLCTEVLEQLRLLSNLETTTRKLIQIILVGQPELADLLRSYELRQLAQRITLSCRLDPLSTRQTGEYIRHRLRIAGPQSDVTFTPGALKTIQRYSRGIPRLINIACDRALLTAFVQDRRTITAAVARRAVRELPVRTAIRPPGPRTWVRAACLIAVLSIPVAMVYRYGSVKVPQDPPRASSEHYPAETASSVPPQPAVPPPRDAVAAEPARPPMMDADLGAVLASIDSTVSRRSAEGHVLSQWGVTRPPTAATHRHADDLDRFRELAARHGLKVQTITGKLEQVRRFNLPAVIPFERSDAPCCGYLALVAADADRAHLVGPTAADRVDALWSEVATRWAGQAHVVWKDLFDPVGMVSPAAPHEAITRLQVLLKDIGVPDISPTGAYDDPTRRAVMSLQRRYGLDQDGVVGPLTKIALLNEQSLHPVPRLAGTKGAHGQLSARRDKGPNNR